MVKTYWKPAVLLGVWLLFIACTAWFAQGCSPIKGDTYELITATYAEILTAQRTLSQARDEGLLDPGGDQYQNAVLALNEAANVLDDAWQLAIDGDTTAAGIGLAQSRAIYARVRPLLLELAEE